MSAPCTLYREIGALGGSATTDHDLGYEAAIGEVLAILERRGFSETGEWSPVELSPMLKGFRRSPKYYPAIGETCRMSGPNCDDADGYTWADVEVLWRDDLFIVTRTANCWPTVTKLELALFEPATRSAPAIDAVLSGGVK